MKRIIYVFSAVLLLSSCTSETKKEDPKKGDDSGINPYVNHSNIPDGEYKEKYDNGIIKIHGYMAGGTRHGEWASFYPSGQLWSEVVYKAGIRNGKTTSYYENGNKRYEGFYKNDTEFGKWQFWEESGKLAKEVDYSKQN